MRILHTADIQIREKIDNFYVEDLYALTMDRVIRDLNDGSFDSLVITGDIFEVYNPTENSKRIFIDFLHRARLLVKSIIITNGNHDLHRTGNNFIEVEDAKIPKIDVLDNIVASIDADNIYYFNETGFFAVDGITYAVWNHKDKIHDKVWNPWELGLERPKGFVIDLFHDPLQEAKDFNGSTFNDKKYKSINDFNGDMFLMGDIHLPQYFTNNRGIKGAYCSSLVANKISEGNLYVNGLIMRENGLQHGYNIVDTEANTIEFVRFDCPFSYHKIVIEDYIDLSEIKLLTQGKNMVRVYYNMPYDPEYASRINTYLHENFNIHHIFSDFKLEIGIESQSSTIDLDNIDFSDLIGRKFMHNEITEYFIGKGYDENSDDLLDRVDLFMNSYDKIYKEIGVANVNILKFGCDNYRSLGSVVIDLPNGITRINAENGVGKTTLFQIIPSVLFEKNKVHNSNNKSKMNILSFFNRKSDNDVVFLYIEFSLNGKVYRLTRKYTRLWKYNKNKYDLHNWMDFISKVESESIISTIENGKFVDTAWDTVTINDFIVENFGTYEEFSEIYETSESNISNLFNQSPENLINYILKNMGLDIMDTIQKEVKVFEDDYTKKNTLYSKIKIEEVNKSIDDIARNVTEKKKYIEDIKIEIENLKEKNKEIKCNISDLNKQLKPFDSTKIEKAYDLIEENKKNEISRVQLLEEKSDLIDELTNTNISTDISSIQGELSQLYDNMSLAKVSLDSINKEISEQTDKVNSFKIKFNDSLKDKKLLNERKKSELENNSVKIDTEISKIINDFNEYKNNLINNAREKFNNDKQIFLDKKTVLENSLNEEKRKLTQKYNTIKDIIISLGNSIDGLNNDIALLEKNSCSFCGKTGAEIDGIKIRLAETNEVLKEKNTLLAMNNTEMRLAKESLDNVEIILADRFFNNSELKDLSEVILISKSNLDSIKELKILNTDFNDTILKLENEKGIIAGNVTEINNFIYPTFEESEYYSDFIEHSNYLTTIKSDWVSKQEIYGAIEKEYNDKNKAYNSLKSKMESIKILNGKVKDIEAKINGLVGKINENKTVIEIYLAENVNKEFNKDIEAKIDEMEKYGELKSKELEDAVALLNSTEKDILLLESDWENKENMIKDFAKQQKELKVYTDVKKSCGKKELPINIFNKISGSINKEMQKMLSDMPFSIYFKTSDINIPELYFMDYATNISYPVYETSGMQQTYATMALKPNLLYFNSKKMDVLFFDEVTGKLDSQYLDKMVLFLQKITSKVNKIILIDHSLDNNSFDSINLIDLAFVDDKCAEIV